MSTISQNNKEFIWAQKYRPQTVDECILPEDIKNVFKSFVSKGEVPNLVLSSTTPGTGKTTIAKALANELNCDLMVINSSETNGIDVARNQIRNFASSMSLSGGNKIIIMDEFDEATDQMQRALRGQLEEFSRNCRFIFTANNKKKIIEPILSRCVDIDFVIKREDKAKMQVSIFNRACEILTLENITYNKKVVAAVVQKYYPDNRTILTQLQKYSSEAGVIDEGILGRLSLADVTVLVDIIKNKKFAEMRAWVEQNLDLMTGDFYEKFYNSIYDKIDNGSKINSIITINNYQRDHSNVASVSIHMAAMFTELMGELEFK